MPLTLYVSIGVEAVKAAVVTAVTGISVAFLLRTCGRLGRGGMELARVGDFFFGDMLMLDWLSNVEDFGPDSVSSSGMDLELKNAQNDGK